MKLFPLAKINLGLNVVERRPDGYHNLETVFYPVNIHDTLEVTPETTVNGKPSTVNGKQSTVNCKLSISGITIEGDTQRNLVVRAYHLLKDDFPALPPVSVRLHKAIPTQAGMGGGSSDCAYMIRLLNE